MKTFSLFLPIFLLLSAPAVHAENLSLKATDGTEIQVGYAKTYQLVEYSSESYRIHALALRPSEMGTHSVTVLVGTCHMIGDTYHFTLSCDNVPGDPWIHVNESCRLDASPYVTRYLNGTLPDLPLNTAYSNGNFESCSYQLAIVRDGVWLTDPMNGTHNFGLVF